MKNYLEKQFKLLDEKPLLFILKFTFIFGLLLLIGLFLQRILAGTLSPSPLASLISGMFIVGFFCLIASFSGVLILINLIYFLRKPLPHELSFPVKLTEAIGLFFGFFFSWLVFAFSNIRYEDWWIQLVNQELHSPLASTHLATFVILAIYSMASYFYLRYRSPEKQPPLATVLGISGLFIGILLSSLWCIQIGLKHPFLLMLPLNLIIIALKTLRYLLSEKAKVLSVEEQDKLTGLKRFLIKSSSLSWAGFLFCFPLLLIFMLILLLFGQEPSSLIKVWTETADWTLSMKTAPPNVYKDTHYLCTVAAQGHPKLTKPLRLGKRCGREILVNRQLSIANAFEELLQEKLPSVQRKLRDFYDQHGYPLAEHIDTKHKADLIYLFMKPLEWFFLIVLYLFDSEPENRIALQYPHRPFTKTKGGENESS